MSDECLAEFNQASSSSSSAKLEEKEEDQDSSSPTCDEQITTTNLLNNPDSENYKNLIIIPTKIDKHEPISNQEGGEEKEDEKKKAKVEDESKINCSIKSDICFNKNTNQEIEQSTSLPSSSSPSLEEQTIVQIIKNESTTTTTIPKSPLSPNEKVSIDLNFEQDEYQHKNNIHNSSNKNNNHHHHPHHHNHLNKSQNNKIQVAKNTHLNNTNNIDNQIITNVKNLVSNPIQINQSMITNTTTTTTTFKNNSNSNNSDHNPIIECEDWSSSLASSTISCVAAAEFKEAQKDNFSSIGHHHHHDAKTNELAPWSCHMCTYINIGQELTCFQCKSRHITNSVTDMDSAFQPKKIPELNNYSNCISNCASGVETATGGGGRESDINFSRFNGGRLYEQSCTSGSKPTSTITSSSSSSIITNNLDWPVGSPISSYETEEKWPCPICTFENWPASIKCVMCLTPREVMLRCESDSGSGRGGIVGHNIQDTSNNNRDNIIVENNRLLSENMASYTVRLRNRGRKSRLESDTRWLEACRGAIHGNQGPIDEYLTRGGDPTRQLTASEVAILNRPSAFGVGYTLVHLALRFQHQDVLNMLLSHLDSGSNTVKRVPSYVAPDLDTDIRNYVMGTIRYGKGHFRCNYSTEIATFTLPSEIEDLSPDIQETLYDEILDRDVQKELEAENRINWSVELNEQLNSRLYALWNRSAGDCLLDSVLQATWGIFDKDNGLRQALASSLRDSASLFYQRWRENEILLSHMLDFSLNENQCAADWDNLLSISGQPGSSLEQLHIFALAHIFRRPIIVYSVKFVKSYLGETLGYARYEGVYLPFLWEASQCWKYPIALGYTRGHFSALVPHEPDCDPLSRLDCAAQLDGDELSSSRCTYLPLNTVDGNLLPIHYLSQSEIGSEEHVLGQWLDLCYTNSGILVARQRIQKRPLLVAQLIEEWLNHYRTLGGTSAPYMRQSAAACYSSDGDSDND